VALTPKFLDPLVLTELDDRWWRVAAEFRYDSAVARCRLIIPEGYVSDLASVPRLPLAWLLAGDTARKAGLVHDFCYSIHQPGNRALADRVFLEAMTVEQVPRWRRWAMYAAVRACGKSRWD
jgi:hypothetical protein